MVKKLEQLLQRYREDLEKLPEAERRTLTFVIADIEEILLFKPAEVKLGQRWKHRGQFGRPLVIIDIVEKPGCSPRCPPEQKEPWAIFRKGKQQPVHDLLHDEGWRYCG